MQDRYINLTAALYHIGKKYTRVINLSNSTINTPPNTAQHALTIVKYTVPIHKGFDSLCNPCFGRVACGIK